MEFNKRQINEIIHTIRVEDTLSFSHIIYFDILYCINEMLLVSLIKIIHFNCLDTAPKNIRENIEI